MSLPSNVDIPRTRADTDPFTVTVTTDGKTPIDITGDSFLFTVDPNAAPADASNNLFQLSVGDGIALTDPTNGIMTLTLSTARAAHAPKEYFYDLQRTSGGVVKTILKGKYTIIQDITK